ncbi:MAG: Crp/Fnr family transcriptional regulator [Cytophagaceae bacterium]|jgi:CRP-like cAMP-binding protein|nr:Crp/Fnr family transcriptional regulator [Cytophagaceae bacterium]
MEDEIIKYISNYTEVSPELETAIRQSGMIRQYPKGHFLLEAGQISIECFFVLKGCVRRFYIKDTEERTTDFYTEMQAIPGISKGTPNEYYLECLEDIIAAVGNPELESDMFQKFPILESFSRVIGESMMTTYVEEFSEFKMASPEERYLKLLESRPDLFQRVPLNQIASYLGIKPESLSRIRKRIMK